MSDQLEAARTALRHAAHVYARTNKKDTAKYTTAVKELERAAILMVAAAAKEGLGL